MAKFLAQALICMSAFVKGVSDTNPIFPLHSKPVYNNIGFSLLGYVIQNVTGLSYEDAVKKYITGPVGMNGTSFLPLSEQDMVIPPVNGDIWAFDFAGYNAYVSPSSCVCLG
jgi:CubicO group peptidase (beta-lactamase class C family)